MIVYIDFLAPFAPLVPLVRACQVKAWHAPSGAHPVRNTVLIFLIALPFVSLSFAIVGINLLSPSTAEGGQQLGGAALISMVWGATLGGYGLALFHLWLAHR